MPGPPNSRPGHHAGERRLHELAGQDHQEQRVEPPLGARRRGARAGGRRAGPRRPAPRALARPIRVIAVSAGGEEPRHQHQHADRGEHRHLGATEPDRQHGHRGGQEVGHGRSVTRDGGGTAPSSSRSRCLHGRRLVGLGVVHAEHVQDAVHDEQRELVVVGAGVRRRVAGRHRRDRSRRRRAAAARRRVERARGRARWSLASGKRPSSTRSSSMGKASTSVGPSTPMNRWLSSAMASSSTNSSDSSASPRTPSACSTCSASRAQRSTSTGSTDCSSATNTSRAPSSGRRRRRFADGGPGLIAGGCPARWPGGCRRRARRRRRCPARCGGARRRGW